MKMLNNDTNELDSYIQRGKVVLVVGLIWLVATSAGYASASVTGYMQQVPDTIKKFVLNEKVANSQPRVSLKLDNVSLSSALQVLAKKARMGLSLQAQVISDKKVTIDVNETSVYEVLDMLLKGTGLEAVLPSSRDVLVIRQKLSQDFKMQLETVQGTVTDGQSGETLPGVNILVKGTTSGTSTDANGNYQLEVPSLQDTLVFTFIGYQKKEVPIDGRTAISIALNKQAITGEELVVVGYGTQKEENLIGAVTSVDFSKDKKMESRSVQNLSTALSGMSSGILVNQNNGAPNESESSITIRGIGSLNAGSNPLIIIDGVVGDLSQVQPNNVAKISVIKDAAAAAIYGSRASNGVILVKTKRGSNTNGKFTFHYNGSYGITNVTQYHDIITNTADHLLMENRVNVNSGFDPPFSKERISEWREKSKTDPIGYPNTDFLKWAIKHTPNYVTNHYISAAGGTEKINLFSSLNYDKNSGLWPNSGVRKINFRSNIGFKINDWVKFKTNLFLRSNKADPATSAGIYSYGEAAFPGQVPRLNVGGEVLYGGAQQVGLSSAAVNPIMQETVLGQLNTREYTGKMTGILTPVRNLKIRGSYYLDRTDYDDNTRSVPKNRWNFRDTTVVVDNKTGSILGLSNNFSKQERDVIDFNIDYDLSLDDHSFHWLGGYNQESFKHNSVGASKRGLLDITTSVFNAASGESILNGTADGYTLRSFFGRFNYNYREKYLLEVNMRYDGASKFSPGNRWGLFPSIAAGWRISEEKFWPDNRVVSNLKLRASYGKLGNSGIGDYEWRQSYTKANASFGEQPVKAINYGAIGNRGITWETTKVKNLGIDIRLLDQFFINFDYYDKYTDGILVREPIPLVNGGLAAPRKNTAEVSNRGYEFNLKYKLQIGDFSLSAGGSISHNKNRIKKYKGDYIEPHGAASAWIEGKPIGVFWIREVDHIVQDQSNVGAMIKDGWKFKPSAPGEGDFMYKDENGDKVINDDDRVLKGHPQPLYTYNAQLSLSYKGFDFYVLADGVAKWDKFLRADGLYDLEHLTGTYLWPKSYLNSWTKDNKNTNIPKVYTNNPINDENSDFFLHKADFLKIRNIQLGYTLPKAITQKASLDKVRAYISLENYFTFTSFPGQDPENGQFTYPSMKIMTFGLQLTL